MKTKNQKTENDRLIKACHFFMEYPVEYASVQEHVRRYPRVYFVMAHFAGFGKEWKMKVLVKTAKMPREEWLKWRTNGIGGSDVSVIFGVNPYRSIFHLWMEKTGQLEPEERETEYTHFGTVLESVVKQEFIRRTGFESEGKESAFAKRQIPVYVG